MSPHRTLRPIPRRLVVFATAVSLLAALLARTGGARSHGAPGIARAVHPPFAAAPELLPGHP